MPIILIIKIQLLHAMSPCPNLSVTPRFPAEMSIGSFEGSVDVDMLASVGAPREERWRGIESPSEKWAGCFRRRKEHISGGERYVTRSWAQSRRASSCGCWAVQLHCTMISTKIALCSMDKGIHVPLTYLVCIHQCPNRGSDMQGQARVVVPPNDRTAIQILYNS